MPPYLLKTGDNPDGVDASVFAGIEKAVAVDRYGFFTGFFQNFYNTDLLLGKRVSEQCSERRPTVPRGWLAIGGVPGFDGTARDLFSDLAADVGGVC